MTTTPTTSSASRATVTPSVKPTGSLSWKPSINEIPAVRLRTQPPTKAALARPPRASSHRDGRASSTPAQATWKMAVQVKTWEAIPWPSWALITAACRNPAPRDRRARAA
jgi:hypothetical protein